MGLPLRIATRLLEDHPEDAARVLERMPDEEIAAVLARMEEARVVARVLEALVSTVASRQLARFEPDRAAEVASDLASDRAADLLRRLDEGMRARILERLSEDRRVPLERLLRFPVDSAGALMDPRFVAFHESRLVGDALSELTEKGADLRYYIYVVDDESTLVGVLSVREAVGAPSGERLHDVMRRPVATLSARAGRRAILGHPGWQRVPSLPVVDEKGRIVGVFRYRTLQELVGAHHEDDDPGGLELALSLGELFWWGASGLFRGLERTDDQG